MAQGPGVETPRGLLSSLFMGPISPCGSPHTGKRKLAVSLFDHIVDDDDQDVLAVTRLGNAQLARSQQLHASCRNDSGLSLEQSAIHNASLQVCVLRGILGLDQSNTDLLANICLLGIRAAVEHAQSLLDCTSGIGVAVDVLLTDDLAG